MLKHTVNQALSLQDMVTSRLHESAGGCFFVARRAKISIEKQDTPVSPIARRAFMPALFMHPLRGIWGKGWRHCSIDMVALTGKEKSAVGSWQWPATA
jgi:hypothetical protein